MKASDETVARRRRIAADVADRARLKRHMQVADLAAATGRHRSVVSEALNGKVVSEETITSIEIALTPPLSDGLLKAILAGDLGRIQRIVELVDFDSAFGAYIIEEMSGVAETSPPERRKASGGA